MPAMPDFLKPVDVYVINSFSGRYMGVSRKELSDGETTSIIGIPKEGIGSGDDVVWSMSQIPPIGREICLVHKKTGAYLTYDNVPIMTKDNIPSYNAVAKKGGVPSYFFRDFNPGGGFLLSLGRAQYLAFRAIGAITGVWAPTDSHDTGADFIWNINEA